MAFAPSPLDYETAVGNSAPSYNYMKTFIIREVSNYSLGIWPKKILFSEHKV